MPQPFIHWYLTAFRVVFTHAVAVYLGAGLSLGLIMASVLPLTVWGVVLYVITWPYNVYCAANNDACFNMFNVLPSWLGQYLFY